MSPAPITQHRCPSCAGPLTPLEAERTVRRGPRSLTYVALLWRCEAEPALDGDGRLEFEDLVATLENTRRAEARWLEKFGEPLPKARRPGPKGDKSERVHAVFDEGTLRKLDTLADQQQTSRSEVLRRLVVNAHHAAVGATDKEAC